ncbi:PREDICTED: uncharacterized protein LOC105951653 [Erythranthe guttata]|uniref:uncharacterized protein LOC105951653 n=1 Tax=Erythranthe guttata TaxID=4155 RepID=UPI00064DEE89|nr:PREDICTED: uncharacterized protein LOC105951653 [Erythranthe guttata]|eukprot:XP_012830557.1 PREDICTED: uncharacterized protein LOC105951653 [Erythranthe guttata]
MTCEEKKTDDGSAKVHASVVSQPSAISPYFLHPSDNPGSLISHIQLKGENYEEWARSMRNALRAKKKLGFVDGTLVKPEDDSNEIEDWWMVNSMLVAWIFNTIEPSLRSTITYVETVKELWEDLRQRFSIGNGPRVHQLKADLAVCKQRGQTVVAYYGRLKMMWDELVNYDPIPTCRCNGCKYDISVTLERKREEERVHQFLMGLDDMVYGTVRSNILSMEPLPNMNRAYAMIVQEERHRNIARSKEDRGDAVGFAAQLGPNVRVAAIRGKEKLITCGQCGKSGHESNACYQVIGYPEWWGDRPRERERSDRGRRGGAVGRGRGGRARINITRATTEGNGSQSEVRVERDRHDLAGLDSEQWTKLLELIGASKNGDERLSGPHYEDSDWNG